MKIAQFRKCLVGLLFFKKYNALNISFRTRIEIYTNICTDIFKRNQYLFQTAFQDLFGVELLNTNGLFHQIVAAVCPIPGATSYCQYALMGIYGYGYGEGNVTLIPEIFTQYPAGTSTKQLVHYLQEYFSGKNNQ